MNSVTQPSIMSRPGAAILLAGLLFLVGGLRVAAQSQPQQLLPDLIVEQITVEPPNPAAGDTVTVTVTIKNQGEAVAGLFAYHLYIEPPTDPPTITTTHTSSGVYGLGLPAGHQIEFSRTGHTLTGDDPVIWAWVDRDGQVAESEEGNNLLRWPTQTVPDAFEDDDLCTAAQPIPTDGTPQERNLHRDPDADLDWVSFTVTGGVTYRLAATAIGADADLELRLYTTCTGQPTLGAGAELSFTAPASGVYFARLSHTASDYGPDTAYRFTVTGQEQCAQYFEPNDACTLAGDLGVGGEAQTHSFCRPNDVDWLRIEVEAGAEYRARATNLGADADAQLGVYQGCQGDTFTEIGAEVEFTALSSGYVYLKTENREPDHYGESATYSVSVTLQSAPGCVADAHEQDDDQSTARPLTVNRGVQTHNTCPAGEQDWVRFETTPGGVYFIQTLNLAEGADTFLCLHSADGIQLRCDDDSGNGLASRLRFTAVDGVYFASVRDYHRTVAGPATQYDLRVTTESCIPDDLEPDNGANNARPIPTDGSRQAHTTCPAGDEDWVTFVAQPGEYTIESVDLGPEADTVIELYDASGNLLAENDDYGPGLASQIVQTLARPGAYYVRVRHYNSTRYGDGTEYSLRVSRGAPPPTPTPTATPSPTPSPTPTATPPASTDARTLILYHQARMAELYDQAAATNLASELATFAGHSQVQGELIRLDNHPAVANAYAAWAGQPNSPTQANAVTTAIRGVVWTYLQQHDGIETVVIVGDDRVIPFRRVPDRTGRETERTYTGVDASHPTGAALRSDYFLTDDFYVDQTPVVQNGVEIYIPDLAIGRLIETPADIIGQLQQFQTDSTLDGSEVLVTGYDFVDDSAQLMCDDWQTDLGEARVDCALIGQSWSVAEFRTRQLAAASRYQIQSINGHANHFFQGAPTGGIGAGEIVGSSSDLAGGLVYTVGCHAGLNVPATNAIEPLDLPEAFARKRVNYVANTGYGWGYRGAVGLSEQVMLLFTRSLLSGPQRSMGAALVEAKQAYLPRPIPLTRMPKK
jgi:hypothetical protein